jgi:fibronectin type 3 domain-containing protein
MHRRCTRVFALVCAAVLFASCDRKSPFEPDDDLSLAALNGGTLRLNAAAVSPDRINLSWQDGSTNETGYELQRSTTGPSGSFTLLANTPSNVTSYGDVSLMAATEYCYRLRAYRTTGKKTTYSAFSNTSCATTQEIPPPPPPPPGPIAPSGTNARPANSLVHSAQINWTDNSADESGFRVERSANASGPWGLAANIGANGTVHIDYGQPMEQQLCYRVVAFYSAGGESTSNVDCTYLPQTPSRLTVVTQSGTVVELKWKDSSAYNEGYDVERSETGGWPFTTVGSVGANDSTFRDATVSANRTYTYRVWVTREGVRAGASNEATAITATDVPQAPSRLDAIPFSSTGISVGWDDASANETGFRIERSENGGATWAIAGSRPANVPGFSENGRTPDQQVCYRVVAFNAVGDSPPSAVGCTAPPAAPTNLVATTAPGLAIDLTWTDNSNVEDGYEVRRYFRECGGYYYYYCREDYATIATLLPNVTSYRDAGLGGGAEHSYLVVAIKDGGGSDASNTASAWSTLPPEAPSNLTASAVSRAQIDLTWSANSAEGTVFLVSRCTGSATTCGDGGFTASFWVGANVLRFSDTSVQPNTTYTYAVQTYNGRFSDLSNKASATTLP